MKTPLYQYEFPDFGPMDVDLAPLLALGYKDASWHNDTCPKFAKDLPSGQSLMIFIDYADKALSESAFLPRFTCYTMDDDGACDNYELSTDDWAAVVAWAKSKE